MSNDKPETNLMEIMATHERELEASATELGAGAVDTFIQYILYGRSMGGFCTAVVENKLMEALGRADLGNQQRIAGTVKWLFNYAPAGCWGNASKVQEWVERGGLVGLYRQGDTLDNTPIVPASAD